MEAEIGQVRTAIADCASRPPLHLTDDALVAVPDECQTAVSQLAALRLSLVREIDGRALATAQDATHTKAWLHARYLIDPTTAARMVGLAADLDTVAPATRTALAAGDINDDQAQVTCKALTEPPTDPDPDIQERAEEHLVGFARTFDPRKLRDLGRRILDTTDPAEAHRREAELLARQEERAHTGRSFTLRPDRLTGGRTR